VVAALGTAVRRACAGAGHAVLPLVRAAAGAGWRVSVVDDRTEFLTSERFPEATGFVDVDSPEDAAKAAGVAERTFTLVMTHNFLRDKGYVRSLLGSPAPYIGMLGPAARTERVLMEMKGQVTDVSGY